MKDETIIALAGMGCSTLLAIAALWKGYDTAIIMSVGTLVGTIVGYAFGVRKKT